MNRFKLNSGKCFNHDRRGVLLLVVVSMLTLFLLLGTTYLVVAARAKQAARAQARLAKNSSSIGIAPARLLDAVLLKVVRGGPGGVNAPAGVTAITGTFESLLGDKYGSTLIGTGSGIAAVTSGTLTLPLFTATVQTSATSASDLPGRVLTLLPPNQAPTSHRILSSSSVGANTFSVVCDKPARRQPFSLPSTTVPIVINGLEFDGTNGNEQWDAFDDDNVFLSHIAPADSTNATAASGTSVSRSVVKKLGYVQLGSTASVIASATTTVNSLPVGADNDNDGVADGVFLDFGLPAITAADGVSTINFHASVLVVDLDSRFNVNAHGSLARLAYPGSHSGWSTDSVAPQVGQYPLGSGYGPAEIAANWMFPKNSYPDENSRRMRGPRESLNQGDNVKFDSYFLSGVSGSSTATTNFSYKRPATSRFSAGSPLRAVSNCEGRYGEGSFVCDSNEDDDEEKNLTLQSNSYPLARPGAPNKNDTLSLIRDRQLAPSWYDPSKKDAVISGTSAGMPSMWWSGTSSFIERPSAYNSPPDLHGRMLTVTATATDVVPRIIFSKPEWGSAEDRDDPYEIRLDRRAARNGGSGAASNALDNVFGYSDLEAVLRPYDIDSNQLPQRLAAILGPAAEEARLRVTTDSWDTSAITGTAAQKIRAWLNSGTGTIAGTTPVTGLVSNEIARGERLNLNRPLTNDKPSTYSAAAPYYMQRQALFKDLFTLLIALSGTANYDAKAQWAANVVEFRDADSTMTPFEYDANCNTSWKVDGDVTTAAGESGNRAVVWGAERPEIVIRETFAWTNSGSGGVVISLHRPWNATALSRVSGTNASAPAEPCDYQLDTLTSGSTGAPTNKVDLGKKPGGAYDDVSPTNLPIWRIRFVDSGSTTQYIRLDSGSASGSNEFVIGPAITDGNGKPKMPVDSTLTIASGTTIITGTGTSSRTAGIALSGSFVFVPNLKITNIGTGTAYLERLSDLGCSLSSSGTVPGQLQGGGGQPTGQDVWDANTATLGALAQTQVPLRYVIVDQCRLECINTQPAAPISGLSAVRTATGSSNAYWLSPSTASNSFTIENSGTISMPNGLSGTNASWFVWPNRPLISPAELFFVPKGSSSAMLSSYSKQRATTNDLLAFNVPWLFDAVHVPSRFAGIHTTINTSGSAALAANGIYPEITPVNQISSYREPGRVNLNTITGDDVWNAVVAGCLTTSTTGTAPKPILTRTGTGGSGANFAANPIKSMYQILALSGTAATPQADTYSGNAPLQNAMARNSFHELYTATRLANTATTRSNVFAIWITVRESMNGDPDSVKYHRGFYIVDRSIPVAYDPGKDHNVWDCVMVRRIIE